MTAVDPTIFKAYDVRGIYPDQLNEDLARQIGRAFVVYLDATRIAVARDMRVSSPSLAAAFIDGARQQGADVVDYGMMGTDMLYYAVARDHLDGGAQVTASHNPKQYNGMKMVRKQAFPLSGDAGISDIREMILSDSIPAPTTMGSLSHAELLDDYLEHVLSFIDPPLSRTSVWYSTLGAEWEDSSRHRCLIACRAARLACVLTSTGPFPTTRPTRSSRKTDATLSNGSWRTGPTPV